MTRALAVALARALAGCGDGESSSPPDMTAACATQCSGPCATGTTCVAGRTFDAACLQPCQTTDDCTGGATCVAIEDATVAGNFCVSDGTPSSCAFCSAPASISCVGDVLMRPYRASVCGLSRTRCPHGCGPNADAGGVVCE